MGMSPPHMHIARYAYLSTVAWRMFHRHSMLRFRVIASQRQLVKSHFISHPRLPRHNSPENRVSGIRHATPQDSSQVFHKTACVAPSTFVLDNTSPVKLAVCQGRLLARWRHSVLSLRTPTPRLIFPVPTSSGCYVSGTTAPVRHGKTFLQTSKGCFPVQTITLDRSTLILTVTSSSSSTVDNWNSQYSSDMADTPTFFFDMVTHFYKLPKADFQFRQSHLIVPHCFWQWLVLLQSTTELANISGFRDLADNVHFLVRHGMTFLQTSKGCFCVQQSHMIVSHCCWQCLLLQSTTEIANIREFCDMADNAHLSVRRSKTFLQTSDNYTWSFRTVVGSAYFL